MFNWSEEVCEITQALLQQSECQYACVVSCSWDSDKELQAIKKCYDQYNIYLFAEVRKQGFLDTENFFQILGFPTLEKALNFCNKIPANNPPVSVWHNFEFVMANIIGEPIKNDV